MGKHNYEIIIAIMGMTVPVVPFVLHVYMIRQISLYNSDQNSTSRSSKKIAHKAWYSLLVAYIVVWALAMGLGWHYGKKQRARLSATSRASEPEPELELGLGPPRSLSPLRSKNRDNAL